MGGLAGERPSAEAIFKVTGILEGQPLELDQELALIRKNIEYLRIKAVRGRSRFSAGWLLHNPALA